MWQKCLSRKNEFVIEQLFTLIYINQIYQLILISVLEKLCDFENILIMLINTYEILTLNN